MKKFIISFVWVLTGSLVWSQHTDAPTQENLKKHVTYLASDALEGRMTGSKGEAKALKYIAAYFEKYGIKPAGDKGYSHAFPFELAPEIVKLNVAVNGAELKRDEYAIKYRENAQVQATIQFLGYGISAPTLGHDDYAGIPNLNGKIAVILTGAPDGNHPHSKFAAYLDAGTKVQKAIDAGASAVILVDEKREEQELTQVLRMISPKVSKPVLAVYGDEKWKQNGVAVTIRLQVKKQALTGHNVVGFIDNGATHNIVIGAHYDHLGWGTEGSLHRGEKAIHNGADDNASGTAVLLELGRILKQGKFTKNNYLLIAFSGEELGLLGSGAFVKSPIRKPFFINYMINMDMVGRLDTATRVMIVNGVGTSNAWNPALEEIQSDLTIKTTESGIGPSDQTSFYLDSVPAIHFFTGVHSDYHKPTDDTEKINFEGMVSVTNYILSLIEILDGKGVIGYVKTKDPEQGKKSSGFKVSMGVVPDYAYTGEGMRISGVTDGKPAELAGLEANDIIIKMGDVVIKDIYGYMSALGSYKKGDRIAVRVLRNGAEVELMVEF